MLNTAASVDLATTPTTSWGHGPGRSRRLALETRRAVREIAGTAHTGPRRCCLLLLVLSWGCAAAAIASTKASSTTTATAAPTAASTAFKLNFARRKALILRRWLGGKREGYLRQHIFE